MSERISHDELEVIIRALAVIARDVYRLEKKIDKACNKLGISPEIDYKPGEYLKPLQEIADMCKNVLGKNHPIVKNLKHRWNDTGK